MVKHIILLGDNEEELQQEKLLLQEFVDEMGWICDVKGYLYPEICGVSNKGDSEKGIDYLTISCQGMVSRIETSQIRHVESHNHKVHIYTENDIYIVYEKLSDILSRLPEEFVQCHKSFLVNMMYIAAIEGKEVVLKEGRRIAISRTYHNHMKERFMGYVRKKE